MPSPESPAKRMTARSMTSRFDLVVGGTSASVDISWPKPPLSLNSPRGVWLEIQDEAARERMVSLANRREPTDKDTIPNRPQRKQHRSPWKDVSQMKRPSTKTVEKDKHSSGA